MAWKSGTASGHEDLLEKFRKWICGHGTATTPDGTGNTGNGTCSAVTTSPATVTETWTVTCTDDSGSGNETWSVTGSVSGLQTAEATTGVAYESDSGEVAFTISDGSTDFVAGDEWTFSTTIGAMTDDGVAWEEQTFASETNAGLAWTRSSTTFTVTLPNHTLAVGEQVTASAWSTSGMSDGVKTITSVNGTTTVSFTGSSTKSGLAWTRSGSTIEVAWTNHGFTGSVTSTVSASSSSAATGNNTETLTRVDANTLRFTGANAGDPTGTLTMTLPTSGTVTLTLDESHVYLKGLGNGGTDEIFVQLRSYRDTGEGYYNVELRGATGFSSGTGKTRINQAGISSSVDMCLWSGSIPYWFAASGRAFRIVAKVGTVYQSAYAGFILPTGLPSEYPYPLAIGGTQSQTRSKYDLTASAYTHRAFFNPQDTLLLIDKAGVWQTFENYNNDSPIANANTCYLTSPYAGATNMRSSNIMAAPIYPNIDGTYSLFPITLRGRATTSVENIFGDLDGVFYVSGSGNASENIVQIDGVDYLVVQSAFRSTAGDFAAFALE
jgi:hypothetical protein